MTHLATDAPGMHLGQTHLGQALRTGRTWDRRCRTHLGQEDAPGTHLGQALLDRAGSGRETYAVISGSPLAEGDVVRIITAQGGGWGDPARSATERRSEGS